MWCVSLYGTDRQVSREVHTGAVRKTQPGRKVATESRRSLQMTTCSPLAEHHLHREPREKRGCDLRLKERLSLQQSVMSHIVWGSPWRARSSVKITAEETNCSTGAMDERGDEELVRKEVEDADSYTSSRPNPSSTCNSRTGAP